MCKFLHTHAQAAVLSLALSLMVPAAVALVHAQSATVAGTITRSNRTAAVNVLVSIAGRSRYTDVQGRYRIDGVPVGRYKMQIATEGKVLLEVEVKVNSTMVVNQTIP